MFCMWAADSSNMFASFSYELKLFSEIVLVHATRYPAHKCASAFVRMNFRIQNNNNNYNDGSVLFKCWECSMRVESLISCCCIVRVTSFEKQNYKYQNFMLILCGQLCGQHSIAQNMSHRNGILYVESSRVVEYLQLPPDIPISYLWAKEWAIGLQKCTYCIFGNSMLDANCFEENDRFARVSHSKLKTSWELNLTMSRAHTILYTYLRIIIIYPYASMYSEHSKRDDTLLSLSGSLLSWTVCAMVHAMEAIAIFIQHLEMPHSIRIAYLFIAINYSRQINWKRTNLTYNCIIFNMNYEYVCIQICWIEFAFDEIR